MAGPTSVKATRHDRLPAVFFLSGLAAVWMLTFIVPTETRDAIRTPVLVAMCAFVVGWVLAFALWAGLRWRRGRPLGFGRTGSAVELAERWGVPVPFAEQLVDALGVAPVASQDDGVSRYPLAETQRALIRRSDGRWPVALARSLRLIWIVVSAVAFGGLLVVRSSDSGAELLRSALLTVGFLAVAVALMQHWQLRSALVARGLAAVAEELGEHPWPSRATVEGRERARRIWQISVLGPSVAAGVALVVFAAALVAGVDEPTASQLCLVCLIAGFVVGLPFLRAKAVR